MTVLEWLQELEEEERIIKVGCVDNTLRGLRRCTARMAAATPTMLPVPMVAASAVQRLWNWLMAISSLLVCAVMSLLVKIAPMVCRSQ